MQLILEKDRQIEALEARQENLQLKRIRIAEVFRDFNVERAQYSGILHRIQDLILHAPNERRSKVFFPHSERRVLEMLRHVCDHLGHVFEAEKGENFNVNIKFVSASEVDSQEARKVDFLHTKGILRNRPPPTELIAYSTVARCNRSSPKTRGDEREEAAMSARDYLVLRDMIEKRSEFLLIEDTSVYVAQYRDLADKRIINSFVYPDAESVKKYQSALTVPIFAQFDSKIQEAN
jgi:hypothetical protein